MQSQTKPPKHVHQNDAYLDLTIKIETLEAYASESYCAFQLESTL